MLPTINSKSLLECNEADLQILIDNSDYRENEYLDYKACFSFLDEPKGESRNKKISEFKNDVCSFANAEGGYLIYGISDLNGNASEIVGINIPGSNTDKFELDRKNNLQSILPKMPCVKFGFIPLSNGNFVVIIFVKADDFAPYIFLENETAYHIYKRIGNGKQAIGYVELKNMFLQSLSIEKEVELYRQSRINYFRGNEDTENCDYSRFMLLHFIPDTFLDTSFRKKYFVLESEKDTSFKSIFADVGCAEVSMPNVDGLRFPNYRSKTECSLNNNGIGECFLPLQDYLIPSDRTDRCPNGRFASTAIWNHIEEISRCYFEQMKNTLDTQRVFVCISIIGCKDVVTEDCFGAVFAGKIDRNIVGCPPVAFEKINNDDETERTIKLLKIEFSLAIGIKYSNTLKALIQELYN